MEYCSLCEKGKGLLVKNRTVKLRIKDVPLGDRLCTLVIIRQRYICKNNTHHFLSDPLPGIEAGHCWTHRLTRYVRAFAKRTNRDIAAETGLSRRSVNIIRAQHAAGVEGRQKHLGKFEAVELDEKYACDLECSVSLDIVAGEYLDLVRDKALTTIEFNPLLHEHRDPVEIVVIDRSNNYAEVAAKLYPTARVICDYFHVVAKAT